MKRTIRAGTFYQHFKNKLYQVITIAYHSESGEPMVVYQALYGNYKVYVRPMEMFLSEVDHEKYPDCLQKYRFEEVDPEKELHEGKSSQSGSGFQTGIQTAGSDNRYLVQFLEAETPAAKLEVLDAMKDHVDAAQVESICLTLDIPYEPGDIEEQLEGIRKVLKMRRHYDGSRLRN